MSPRRPICEEHDTDVGDVILLLGIHDCGCLLLAVDVCLK
jgi:hypothetical protein